LANVAPLASVVDPEGMRRRWARHIDHGYSEGRCIHADNKKEAGRCRKQRGSGSLHESPQRIVRLYSLIAGRCTAPTSPRRGKPPQGPTPAASECTASVKRLKKGDLPRPARGRRDKSREYKQASGRRVSDGAAAPPGSMRELVRGSEHRQVRSAARKLSLLSARRSPSPLTRRGVRSHRHCRCSGSESRGRRPSVWRHSHGVSTVHGSRPSMGS
jgi:hypothetical protein